MLDGQLPGRAPGMRVGFRVDHDPEPSEPLKTARRITLVATAAPNSVAQHIGDLQSPERGYQPALPRHSAQYELRGLGPLIAEEPCDRHRRIDDDAHPRRPSSRSSRIVTSPREWLRLSLMISSAAASASARARATGRRITISPSCASIWTRSPSLSPAALANSRGNRTARFFPHLPMVTWDMETSNREGYSGISQRFFRKTRTAVRRPASVALVSEGFVALLALVSTGIRLCQTASGTRNEDRNREEGG